jgi:hypothetical protein
VCDQELENEEAKSPLLALKIQPQWVVKPAKQRNKQREGNYLI